MILNSIALEGALPLLLHDLSVQTNQLSCPILRLSEIEPTDGDNPGLQRTDCRSCI